MHLMIRIWEVTSLFLVVVCGCLSSTNQSVCSYFPMFLFAAFYCLLAAYKRMNYFQIALKKSCMAGLNTGNTDIH